MSNLIGWIKKILMAESYYPEISSYKQRQEATNRMVTQKVRLARLDAQLDARQASDVLKLRKRTR